MRSLASSPDCLAQYFLILPHVRRQNTTSLRIHTSGSAIVFAEKVRTNPVRAEQPTLLSLALPPELPVRFEAHLIG